VQLEPVRDVAALADWHAIEVATRDADHVALPAEPFEERKAVLEGTAPDAGEQRLLRLGRVDGLPVAAIELVLPTMDNVTACTLDLRVHPDFRRRGHAREALSALLDELVSVGRTRTFFEVPSPYPAGEAPAARLLRAVGARPVLRELRRLLDLHAAATPPPRTVPSGYRLVQWVERAPDELVDDLAYLMHRMSTDVPLGEMDWEPEVWDAQRYRDKEEAAIAQGRVRYATAAVCEATGRAAGFTDIGVSRFARTTAYQWETLVDREHRGHGLGLVLKFHNHRLVMERSPQTRWVNTWNAESNTHMVAINDQLGFEPVEYWTEWQRDEPA
jgi:GNAT superfamily N-acetyltransferase